VGCVMTLVLSPSSLFAQELKAIPLREGEPAPFAGQLLNTELAISLGLKAEQCQKRIEIELGRQTDINRLELDYQKQLRKIDAEKRAKEIEVYQKQLDKSEVWYRHPIFVASVTFVLTVGSVLVAISAIEATQ